MSFYGRQIFPRLMERTLVAAGTDRLRREALAPATGQVLELGLGTGLNLTAYPPAVDGLVAVDQEAPALGFVKRRLQQSPVPVDFRKADACHLPFEDERFDCVVTTWTLCSLARVGEALLELRRVLRDGGRYLFLEHGLGASWEVQRYQHRIAPLTRIFGCGCRPDRPIVELIKNAGFVVDAVREETVHKLGRASGHLFLGRARR